MSAQTARPAEPANGCGDGRIAALVGLLAALVYTALGQTTLHHNDGHRILELLAKGELDFGRHHLATPLMYAFHEVLGAPLGLQPHRSVTLLNALSSGVAVALLFSGGRLLALSRARAGAAATLFGACYPVLFFATLVEFHGVFLPWVTASFWLACRWIRRDGFGVALAVGATAGVATQVHSMGVFASGLFALWFWASRPDLTRSRRAAQGLAAIATHALVFLAFTAFWQSLGWSVGSALGALPTGAELFGRLMSGIAITAWRELLLPFLPLPLFAAWSLTQASERPVAIALFAGCAPYLALSTLILGVSEHGAYLAAVAAPMSLLAARTAPLRLVAAAAVLTATVTAGLTWNHDSEGARYRGFVTGLEQLVGEGRMLLLYCEDPVPGPDAHVDELAAVRIFSPTTESMRLESLAAQPTELVADQIVAMAGALPALQAGARLVMGKATVAALRTRYQSGPLLLSALEQVYRREPRRLAGFDGFELLVK